MKLHVGILTFHRLRQTIKELRLGQGDKVTIHEEDFLSMVLDYQRHFGEPITNPFWINDVEVFGMGTWDMRPYHIAINIELKPKPLWRAIKDFPSGDRNDEVSKSFIPIDPFRKPRHGWRM